MCAMASGCEKRPKRQGSRGPRCTALALRHAHVDGNAEVSKGARTMSHVRLPSWSARMARAVVDSVRPKAVAEVRDETARGLAHGFTRAHHDRLDQLARLRRVIRRRALRPRGDLVVVLESTSVSRKERATVAQLAVPITMPTSRSVRGTPSPCAARCARKATT